MKVQIKTSTSIGIRGNKGTAETRYVKGRFTQPAGNTNEILQKKER